MSYPEPIPNNPFQSTTEYYIDSNAGSLVLGNGLIVTSDGTLLVTSSSGGTVNEVIAGEGLSGGSITLSGTIDLKPATGTTLGGIKVGNNLSIAPDGTLSASAPGIGTITRVTAGTGLSGGAVTGNATLNLAPATSGTLGGVRPGTGLDITPAGVIFLMVASESGYGGVQLATAAEVAAGTDTSKAVTPATLSSKVASTSASGIVQLTDSVVTDDSTLAATATAIKAVNTAAVNAQTVADGALPKAGGVMTGVITFAPSQSFPGVSFPVATSVSPGVVQVGSGLSVTPGGVLSATNVGTVTSIQAGTGLGAPATGNQITSSGAITLLPPTATQIGGVKAGSNINIAVDGTINVAPDSFLLPNNPYAFNSYIWPASRTAPALPCPGDNGQVLTIVDSITGTLGWTSGGNISSVTAGVGISTVTANGDATVSLATVPSVTPGTYGGQGIIPVVAVNSYGQIVSSGTANTYGPFQNVAVAAPSIDLDFTGNALNRTVTLTGNTVINNPLNAQSGQRGTLVIVQNSSTPYTVSWGSAWKFADGLVYGANTALSSVDLLEFVVLAGDNIVVTNVVSSIS
jgi:hypothetical protein